MIDGTMRLSQIAMLTGLRRHAINARAKTTLDSNQIKRMPGNQILLDSLQVNTLISDRLVETKGKVIYIGNLKGGVGKTTIAYLLISAISALGLKVCGIDLDAQANLTRQFLNIEEHQPVFFDIVDDSKIKLAINDVILPVSSTLDFIPSSLKNSRIQSALTMQGPKHHQDWLNTLCLEYLRKNYNVIIVDTPPHLTTLNSVFCACLENNDHIAIPACAEDFSIMGVQMFLEDVMKIRSSYKTNTNPNISIIMNRIFQNQTTNLEMLFKMRETYKEMLSDVIIRDSAKLREIINNKIQITNLKNAKEIYETISRLLQEFQILKKVET